MRTFTLLIFLSACGGDPEPPGELLVELGTGEVAFEALGDGTTLPLIAGPQGGHHVWLGFRVTDARSERAFLTVEPIPLTTGEPPPRSAPVRIFLSPMPDGRREYFGWPAQLADPACLVGEPLILRVTIEDERGNRGSDERTIVVGEGLGLAPCGS